jgi:hypothetical protein
MDQNTVRIFNLIKYQIKKSQYFLYFQTFDNNYTITIDNKRK